MVGPGEQVCEWLGPLSRTEASNWAGGCMPRDVLTKGVSAQESRRGAGLKARGGDGNALRLAAVAVHDMVGLGARPGGELRCNRVVGRMEGQAKFANAVGGNALVTPFVLDAVLKARLLREQHQRGQGMQQPDACTASRQP